MVLIYLCMIALGLILGHSRYSEDFLYWLYNDNSTKSVHHTTGCRAGLPSRISIQKTKTNRSQRAEVRVLYHLSHDKIAMSYPHLLTWSDSGMGDCNQGVLFRLFAVILCDKIYTKSC